MKVTSSIQDGNNKPLVGYTQQQDLPLPEIKLPEIGKNLFVNARSKWFANTCEQACIPIACETPSHAMATSGEHPADKTLEPQSEAGKRKKGTRRGTLNAEAKNVLKAWMFSPEHFAHPYPSEEEKEELAAEAGIEVKQLSNWFTNARKRLWQPVLRQSGVEVKNFLSTGRGGPRGQKLEVPANIHLLVGANANQSPVSALSRKRSFDSDFEDDSDESSVKNDPVQSSNNKRLQGSAQLNSPSCHGQVPSMWNRKQAETSATDHMGLNPILSTFQEQEIKAAESLLGLHVQCQSVH